MSKTDAQFDTMTDADFATLCRSFDKQDAVDDDFAFEFDASVYSTIELEISDETLAQFYGAQAQR